MPILEGLDGTKKMSKSSDNYISINEEPYDMFAKTMSLGDELMWRYYELLSFVKKEEVLSMKQETDRGTLNPKDVKKKLALELVDRFHGKKLAKQAQESFSKRVEKKEIPIDIPEIKIKSDISSGATKIIDVLTTKTKILQSTSEARRLIKQKAIKIDGKPVTSIDFKCSKSEKFVLQVGKKKAYKITIT